MSNGFFDQHGRWIPQAAYHPDPAISAEVAADALEGEVADLAAGLPPRRWRCPECGTEHGRGHFEAIGQHRCLGCGYIGTEGVMTDG